MSDGELLDFSKEYATNHIANIVSGGVDEVSCLKRMKKERRAIFTSYIPLGPDAFDAYCSFSLYHIPIRKIILQDLDLLGLNTLRDFLRIGSSLNEVTIEYKELASSRKKEIKHCLRDDSLGKRDRNLVSFIRNNLEYIFIFNDGRLVIKK